MNPGDRVQLVAATGIIERVRGEVAEVRWDTGARSPVPLAWLSPAPGCRECGAPIEAQRSSRKYCSATCRKRASRCHANSTPSKAPRPTPNVRQGARSDARRAAAA